MRGPSRVPSGRGQEAAKAVADELNRRKLQTLAIIADAAGAAGMVGGQVADIESEGKKVGAETVDYIYEPGPEAAARRVRAFARMAEDPSRAPDIPGLGPECPSDEAAYYNLFGEA